MRRFRFEYEPCAPLWMFFLDGVDRPRAIATEQEALDAIGPAPASEPVVLATRALFRRLDGAKSVVLMPWEPIVIERYHDRAALYAIQAYEYDSFVHGLAGDRTWWHVAGDTALEPIPTADEQRLAKLDRERRRPTSASDGRSPRRSAPGTIAGGRSRRHRSKPAKRLPG